MPLLKKSGRGSGGGLRAGKSGRNRERTEKEGGEDAEAKWGNGAHGRVVSDRGRGGGKGGKGKTNERGAENSLDRKRGRGY